MSLSTSESRDHECQQTHWGAFLCAFQRLFNEITGCIVCFGQTQVWKKGEKKAPHSPNHTPRQKETAANKLYSPKDTANLLKSNISRREPPTWFSCLIKTWASLALKWISQLPINHCFSTPLSCLHVYPAWHFLPVICFAPLSRFLLFCLHVVSLLILWFTWTLLLIPLTFTSFHLTFLSLLHVPSCSPC